MEGNDGTCLGKLNLQERDQQRQRKDLDRLVVDECVEKESENYNMNHRQRGKCLIFYYSKYSKNLIELDERKCAENDAAKAKEAFQELDFEVKEFHNLTKSKFEDTLSEVADEDHSHNDCLAVVFMSHGNFDEEKNKQFLYLYDSQIEPENLWEYFCASRCPSLIGKPKLFFIQACRGTKTDQGIKVIKGLPVEEDADPISDSYSIPSYSDLLVMWASFPGFFAFKSNNNGINGSVFIHFLAKVLLEIGKTRSLISMIYAITRKVAFEYESNMPGDSEKDFNKQIPQIESTLMRNIFFYPKEVKKI